MERGAGGKRTHKRPDGQPSEAKLRKVGAAVVEPLRDAAGLEDDEGGDWISFEHRYTVMFGAMHTPIAA